MIRLIQIVMVAVKDPSVVVTVIVEEPPPVEPPVTDVGFEEVDASVA